MIGVHWIGLLACIGEESAAPPSTPEPAPETEDYARLLSLDPGIGEVVYALGEGGRMVGRSDYAVYPPEVQELPKAGSALTPNLEAISRLQPDLIVVGVESSSDAVQQLKSLAPTQVLPWLTLEETSESIMWLGDALGREQEAAELVERYRRELGQERDPDAPSMLLLLGQPSETQATLWFIRSNSLHNGALRAAGFQNAIPEPVDGLPSLPLERLVELDPDCLVVLLSEGELSPAQRAEADSFWSRFSTLKAVQRQRVSYLAGEGWFSTGPRLLELDDALRRPEICPGLER